tara:strand:- start:1936 stop:2205 length:270 start_codon:yes stop_codon:yes gene_type:complete
MDEKIQKVLEEKICESTNVKDEITTLVNSLVAHDNDKNTVGYGIIIGRLYNSFYYQSRRILKRDPTKQEFSEFVKFLKKHENELSQILT